MLLVAIGNVRDHASLRLQLFPSHVTSLSVPIGLWSVVARIVRTGPLEHVTPLHKYREFLAIFLESRRKYLKRASPPSPLDFSLHWYVSLKSGVLV